MDNDPEQRRKLHVNNLARKWTNGTWDRGGGKRPQGAVITDEQRRIAILMARYRLKNPAKRTTPIGGD